MERSVAVLIANLALLALVWYLRSRATKQPQRFWVYLLYGLQVGPRTDTKYMSKSELLDSGLRFITWGLIFSSAFWGIGVLGRLMYPIGELPSPFFLLWLCTALFSGMGVLGGLYLIVRWACRRTNYAPPPYPPTGDA